MSLDRNLLLKLAREYGTPLYVYDGDLILRRYRELYDFIAYPKLKIHYAMKANYNFRLLRELRAAGAGIDAVSPGDVLLALKAGFSPADIIYTANNVTDDEVRQVRATGVLMNIGSLSRLEKFGSEFPGSEICLRFNPDVVDGEHAKLRTGGDLTKFGILLRDVEKVREIVARRNLRVVGLHEHTGSGLQHTASVFKSMENLMAIATPANFPDLRLLDFGGGFKVPYRPDEPRVDYAAMGAEITRRFREFCARYGKELALYFEPGKYIAAEGGYLLVTVNTLKNNRGRLIAGCNSGFPQLIRPMFYDAYHRIENLSNPAGPERLYDVCGNICETGDNFAVQRGLPEIRENDVLAIRNAGAYCYSMGGVYNLRAMPPEIFVKNGRAKPARRGLSSEELINLIIGESN
ncbi:MAG: diaminopimelate decarboxylase [Victivallales bacterium]|nr:diaminopimelate decarboxylase [Victivallales bacterium]